MAKGVPERWETYSPIGERIQGTRFIAFKVPLHENLSDTCEEYLRLDIKKLLKNVPNLGAIVDLTNTHRYYNPENFRSAGIEYFKLMIPGHATPPSYLVKKFKIFVRNFLQNNKRNDKLIGIHCTHGVNRTGYLICDYMITEMSIKPSEAILAFRSARGYPIERKNYIDALHSLRSKTKDRRASFNGNELTRKQESFSIERQQREKDNRPEHLRESRNRKRYIVGNRLDDNRNSYSNGSIQSRSRRDDKSSRSFTKTPSHINSTRDWSRKRNDTDDKVVINRRTTSKDYRHSNPLKRPFDNDNHQSWRPKYDSNFNSNSFEAKRSRQTGCDERERDEKYKNNNSSQSWRKRDQSNYFNPFRARCDGFVEKSIDKREEQFTRHKTHNQPSWRNNRNDGNHFNSNHNSRSEKTWNRNNFQNSRIRNDRSENNFDRKPKWTSSRNGRT